MPLALFRRPAPAPPPPSSAPSSAQLLRKVKRIEITTRRLVEQGRLHLGGGAVDLVGEQQLSEDGALAGHELAGALVVDEGADEVGRQQVGSELDALEADRQRPRQGLDGQRLGEAGDPLDQQVAAAEHADQHAVDEVLLADQYLAQLGFDLAEGERLLGEPVLEVAAGKGWRGGCRLHGSGRRRCKGGATASAQQGR